MSDVTVVMSAYREDPDLFRQAVDSILAQSMPDLELLIALDDPGNEELRHEAEGYAARDSRVRVTVNERNLGLAASLNRAVSCCSSKYVCRMDADDVALPDRIERQLAFIEAGGYDLVGGGLDVTDGAGELLYHAQRLPQSPEAVRRALRWNNCVPHPSWLGRRWVFEQGYRQIPLCEDYDLLIRTALAGGRMANVPGAVLRYRMGEESISRSSLYEQYLYMRYLTRQYARGRAVDVAEARTWVAERLDAGRSSRYLRANGLFNEAMGCLEGRRPFGLLALLLRIALTSPAYVNKMFRLLMASRQ